MKKGRGFTIVEMVIVIAIIAILASVLLPTFQNAVGSANTVSPKVTARSAMLEFLASGTVWDKSWPIWLETGGESYVYVNEKLDRADNFPRPVGETRTVYTRTPGMTDFDPAREALTLWRGGGVAYILYPAGIYGEDTEICTAVREDSELYYLSLFAGDWNFVARWEALGDDYFGYPEDDESLPAAILTKATISDILPAAEAAPAEEVNFLAGQTYIKQSSFSGYSSLTTVTLPATVTRFDDSAFNELTKLENIEVEADNPNYKSVDGVLLSKDGKTLYRYPRGRTEESYAIPDGVEKIASYAFYCCRLTKISVPASTSSVAGTAFYISNTLAEFVVSDGSEHFKSDGGVLFTKDGKTLLRYPPAKTGDSYTVPDGVEVISDYSFFGNRLSSIELCSTITEVGQYAFAYCNYLSELTMHDGISVIGSYAFYLNKSIKRLSIPAALTAIGENAFIFTSSLSEIAVSGSKSFTVKDGVLFSADMMRLIRCPVSKEGSYTVPDSVRTIDDGAFFGCGKLTSVALTDGIEGIGQGAFQRCTALTEINIPDSVTEIENNAFYDCNNLTSLALPQSLTMIGSRAFSGCAKLQSVYIPKSCTAINGNAFASCTSLSEVTYGGTADGWRAITIGSGNDKLTGAHITYAGE